MERLINIPNLEEAYGVAKRDNILKESTPRITLSTDVPRKACQRLEDLREMAPASKDFDAKYQELVRHCVCPR